MYLKIFLIVSAVFCSYLGFVKTTLVCDNFQSYYKPDKKHCYDNQDGERNISEIIRDWGFTAEEYTIYTEDGYEILIVRAYKNITQKTPLVLGHGLGHNALLWIIKKEKSFVHHYGSKGFDTWIVNFRGTHYSRGHRYLTTNNSDYWSFSFHEMAIYDLSTALTLVKEKTKQKAIFVGFSMGTTISYIYSIKMINHAKNTLVGIISLAPVAYLKNMKSYLTYLVPYVSIVKELVYYFSHGEVLPQSPILKYICTIYPWQMQICSIIKGLAFGFNFKQLDPLLVPLIYIKILDSIGIEVIVHFSQLIKSEKFQEKDFGENRNYRMYGQHSPPLYNLSKIPVPVALHISRNDWITTTETDQTLTINYRTEALYHSSYSHENENIGENVSISYPDFCSDNFLCREQKYSNGAIYDFSSNLRNMRPIPIVYIISSAIQLYSELDPKSRCGFYLFENEYYVHSDVLESIDVVSITYASVTKSITKMLTGKCVQ